MEFHFQYATFIIINCNFRNVEFRNNLSIGQPVEFTRGQPGLDIVQ